MTGRHTQAVFYRDWRGREPVDEFLENLLKVQPLAAAKIDDAVEEHLNGRDPRDPPPEFPLSSQIDGELRELRVRFGKTRYRLLYQRSRNLIVLLNAFEKNTGATLRARFARREPEWRTFKCGSMRVLDALRVPPAVMLRHLRAASNDLSGVIS